MDGEVCMMGVLLEDVSFEDLSHIERVEPETEGLGRDIEDVCKPRLLDSWKLMRGADSSYIV